MRAWSRLAVVGMLIVAATPALGGGLAPRPGMLKLAPGAARERLATAEPPASAGVGPAPVGLRVTTVVGGAASRERIEGRLETRTKLVFPQIGCWHAWTRGFFLGLELGWSVASGAPGRSDAAEPRREGGGLAGLARPTTSILHLGWSR